MSTTTTPVSFAVDVAKEMHESKDNDDDNILDYAHNNSSDGLNNEPLVVVDPVPAHWNACNPCPAVCQECLESSCPHVVDGFLATWVSS